MGNELNIRMQTPGHLTDDLQEILKENEINAEEISDKGGLKDVMAFFNVAVQMTSFVALGLQVYDFLRKKKNETGNSHTIKIEAPGVSGQPLSLAIDPGKAKPVIKIQLENLQKQFERNQLSPNTEM